MSRPPASAVLNVPSGTGRYPVITCPPDRTVCAAVSPIGQSFAVIEQAGAWKNVEGAAPLAGTSVIVVPVPWVLVRLLKFATRMSPVLIAPPVGKPAGTKFTPYGFRSPLPLTVETVFSVGRKPAALAVAPMANRVVALMAAAPMADLTAAAVLNFALLFMTVNS